MEDFVTGVDLRSVGSKFSANDRGLPRLIARQQYEGLVVIPDRQGLTRWVIASPRNPPHHAQPRTIAEPRSTGSKKLITIATVGDTLAHWPRLTPCHANATNLCAGELRFVPYWLNSAYLVLTGLDGFSKRARRHLE